jgi:hypothetical protein
MTRRALHLAQILWPAFVIAGVIEMVVFSMIDPSAVRMGAWEPDARTVYSLSFLVFWALVAASSALSHLMMRGAHPGQVSARRARRQARRAVVMQHQP